MHRAIAFCLAIAWTFTLCGCAIRYDQAGVSRVGPFLWGFGDPPGVNWNLNEPRRETPDLPAARHRELPPRDPVRTPPAPGAAVPNQSVPDRVVPPIDDNRDRASRASQSIVPLAARAGDRDDDATRP